MKIIDKLSKHRKRQKCAWAVSYLDSIGVKEYMQMRFDCSNSYRVKVYHADHGQILGAEKTLGMSGSYWTFDIFRYGSWVDQLLEYEQTVRSAEKKKRFEDLQEAFKDLEE